MDLRSLHALVVMKPSHLLLWIPLFFSCSDKRNIKYRELCIDKLPLQYVFFDQPTLKGKLSDFYYLDRSIYEHDIQVRVELWKSDNFWLADDYILLFIDSSNHVFPLLYPKTQNISYWNFKFFSLSDIGNQTFADQFNNILQSISKKQNLWYKGGGLALFYDVLRLEYIDSCNTIDESTIYMVSENGIEAEDEKLCAEREKYIIEDIQKIQNKNGSQYDLIWDDSKGIIFYFEWDRVSEKFNIETYKIGCNYEQINL